MTTKPQSREVLEIASVYDSLYRETNNVWEDMGRNTEEFIQYFTSLLGWFQPKRFLEVGCGEGFLLDRAQACEKCAIDLSREAIKAARAKTRASFCVALAEALPFRQEYFDLVVSVGVMEHFLDEKKALEEIRRVLKPGGHYVNLIHVRLTLWDRCALKIPEFLYPWPRPLRFAGWLMSKLAVRDGGGRPKNITQPIQRTYTTRGAAARLEKNGFGVIDVIHARKHPDLPLRNLQVVIYIGRK